MSVPVLENYVLNLMNNDRKAKGLPPYTRNNNMDSAARTHSEFWLKVGTCPPVTVGGTTFSEGHICPGEADPCTRIVNALGGPVMRCGENVGWGYDLSPTPNFYGLLLQVHQKFMSEGPSAGGFNHYDNIMSSIFNKVGVGVAVSAGSIRFTVDFAKQ